ncbi:hypothetical protein HOL59_05620 [Candidatus Woesearchaeota archaeon]|jgi:hypothetical protein|nr:hypothetical protein [Candidatus Woesearchaeota archaeon]
MELEAIIEHNGDEKYIFAHVVEGEKEKYVLVSLPYDYHDSIARAFVGSLSHNSHMDVLGGGILTMNHQNKTIKTYGTSGSFGNPPINLVRDVLEEKFPDYAVDARVTGYIRG